MSQKRQKILFLDDDANFLELLQNTMQSFAGDGWEIHTANNAGQALAIIQDKHIDLVVVDLEMPVVDGMQFLTLLNRKHPNLVKVVLSGTVSETQRATCLSLGAELVLDKAQTQTSWQSVYSTLNELVRLHPEDGFRGVLRRVSLQDVLQMECLSRSSAILEVSTKQLRGHIFIHEGQIIHSEAGQRTGEEAFNFLMSLTGGDFNLKPFVEPAQRTITSSWEFLLMESARKQDEASEPTSPLTADPIKAGPRKGPSPPSTRDTKFFSKPDAFGVDNVNPRPETAELLICSVQGDVLYEWQCADSSARIGFLEFISQKARQLSVGLCMGSFERLEIHSPRSRVIAQMENEHAIFVRTNLLAAA